MFKFNCHLRTGQVVLIFDRKTNCLDYTKPANVETSRARLGSQCTIRKPPTMNLFSLMQFSWALKCRKLCRATLFFLPHTWYLRFYVPKPRYCYEGCRSRGLPKLGPFSTFVLTSHTTGASTYLPPSKCVRRSRDRTRDFGTAAERPNRYTTPLYLQKH